MAPSLIPKKPGDRVKTDKRDAAKLAKLFRADELSTIYEPEAEDEAIRDLSRAHETAMKDLKDAKLQLKGFFLRNNITTVVKDNWSKKHLRWLTELVLPHHSQHLIRMTNSARRSFERNSRHCLAGTIKVVPTLSTADVFRQTSQCCCHGNCERNGSLHLGYHSGSWY